MINTTTRKIDVTWTNCGIGFLPVWLLICFSSFAQVGINTTSPNAILDIQSSNQVTPSFNDGILIPKIDNFPTVSPTANQDGMLVFVTGNGTSPRGFYFWDNGTTSWVLITSTIGTSNTLDKAYDHGGAGVGKNIDATDGSVRINGEDGFLVTGIFGNGISIDAEIVGSGTRMFFNPNKAAFRAGRVFGNYWNDTNIGTYSAALGHNTTASGESSFAMGFQTSAAGNYATAFSNQTSATGIYSMAFGLGTTATEEASTAFGEYTTASGVAATAFGTGTTATGYESTAFGLFTTASGDEATAFGVSTTASGQNSLAFGNGTLASGDETTAFGFNTISSGVQTTAFGRFSNASGFVSTAFGYQTIASGGTSTAFGYETIADGYQFSTAFGYRTVASGVLSSTAFGYETSATGDHSTAFGYQTSSTSHITTAFGNQNIASGVYATAFGSATEATGQTSTSFGIATISSGLGSTAFGQTTLSSGGASTAFGISTLASGDASTSFGIESEATGYATTALGYGTNASSFSEITIGTYNTIYTPTSSSIFNSADKIFVIGNGTSESTRSNALTIYKNGLMNINDSYDMPLTDGTANQVMVTNGAGVVSFQDANILNGNTLDQAYDQGGFGAGRIINATNGAVEIHNSGGLIVESTNETHMLFVDGTNDAIGVKTANPTADLSVNGTVNKLGGGTWGVFSDARLKKNISNYDEGLELILQVKPVNFSYNSKMGLLLGTNKSIENRVYQGVIAQDLQKIAPDMVREVVINTGNDQLDTSLSKISSKTEQRFLEVDPNKFTYALINAVQEQQEMIDKLQNKIDDYNITIDVQNTKIAHLEKLLKQQQIEIEKIKTLIK